MQQYYWMVLVFLFSCAEKDAGHLYAYQGLVELTIKIPNSITPLNVDIDFKDHLSKHDQNIIVVLKSDCMNCILELDRWRQWVEANELVRSSAISIIIVNPITYLLEAEIIDKHSYPFPIYVDPNSDFMKVNNLTLLEAERLLIIDRDNRIVFLGSPLSFPELHNSFMRFIDH